MQGAIDAGRPWLAPLQPELGLALAHWQPGAPVADVLNARIDARLADPHAPPHAPAPALACGALRFVPQTALPKAETYEAFIHRSAQVPSRDNVHDFFNGLVWLAQPAIKRRLNELQAAEIARAGIGTTRGPLRDALTLFDENGALLQAPAELLAALRARDWPSLFISQRARWAEASLLIVGHALLEKLAAAPRKALTAHVLLGDPLRMSEADWAAKPFAPLPVLGVPGWWPANEEAGFYDDPAVFRPQAGKNPSIDKYRSPVS